MMVGWTRFDREEGISGWTCAGLPVRMTLHIHNELERETMPILIYISWACYAAAVMCIVAIMSRSEERRVGKEC